MISGAPTAVLRVGLAGLGAAAGQVTPAFDGLDRIRLGGVADVRQDRVAQFSNDHDVPGFSSVAEMCASDAVDAVWVATPNELHAEHTVIAAQHGKHVICEKPMAVSLDEADAMIAAAEQHGVKLIQGHSKIYEAPIKQMRQIIASGELGRVIQVHTWNFNDWLLRPRLPSEVDTTRGGGVVYRQGPHQVDIVRCLAGGEVRTVRAVTGRHQAGFDTEGDYTALLTFADGAAATLVFNGYGRFDVSELTWNITEGGRVLEDSETRRPRPRPSGPVAPEDKYHVSEHGGSSRRAERRQPFFGLTVVSCESGDIRQSPDGLFIYTDEGRREVHVGANLGRRAELLELADSVSQERPAFPDGHWGKASLEVCLAVLESARRGAEVSVGQQTRPPDGWPESAPGRP